MDYENFLTLLVIYGLPAIMAITLHEAAHGFVALYCGDTTAKQAGRLTLNPLKHIDPIGTLLLPGLLIFTGAPFLFGYAKPVPVAFNRLHHPKRDMVWVAFAGPATNILLAVVSALFIKIFYQAGFSDSSLKAAYFIQTMIYSIHINVTLALFNMIPIPPLDGGRVLTGLLPAPYDQKLALVERYGFIIIFVLFFIMPSYLGTYDDRFYFFNHHLMTSITYVKDSFILPLTGLPMAHV